MPNLRFHWVVAASGAIVMALEILSARILAPTFGSSVYVWGSIISVFLAALSLGYLIGGRLADLAPRLGILGRLLTLAVGLEWLLLRFGVNLAEGLGALFGTDRYGALITTACLFGPITTLLATVSPFAVRLAAREMTSLGNVSGRLFALSTVGSLLGTLGCTFLLIPFLDVEHSLLILIGLTTVTALAALSAESRWLGAYAAVALSLCALAVIGVRSEGDGGSDGSYRRMTPYQTLEVRERDGVRALLSDGRFHGAISLDSGDSTLGYVRAGIVPLLFDPDLERVAVLGLGAGSYGRYLRKFRPDLEVDNVEIDSAVVEVAKASFGFVPSEKERVIVRDARRFLDDVPGDHPGYDLIFSDTYLGLSVPFHLTTREFVRLARERLTEDGMLLINVAADLEHPFSSALYATVASEFDRIYLFRTPAPSSNHLVLAVPSDRSRLGTEELVARAQRLAERYPYRDPSLGGVARGLIEVDREIRSEEVLRDAFAPVDRLIHLGRRRAWRGPPAAGLRESP